MLVTWRYRKRNSLVQSFDPRAWLIFYLCFLASTLFFWDLRFLAVFFGTLAFAFVEPFFFIGYLISIAIFGLYQAIFMANAGAAWDNAKKIVEVELKQKGTELHAATVIGDTVGDPFKDTSSVAMNPVIKFTTLFGLLAVSLAVSLTREQGGSLSHLLALVFFLVSFTFVYRSFYGMRIAAAQKADSAAHAAADD